MTLCTNGYVVKIGKATTCAAIEDGIAIEPERPVGEDAKARGGWPLDGAVELELIVVDNFASTALLVGEDAILQGDDGIGGADGLTLGGYLIGDVVGGDFEGTGEVFITTVRSLT